MKYHVTHCVRCGSLILCDKSGCAPPDHICYGCIQASIVENTATAAESPAKSKLS